ncbi:DUF4251 domain-containing protein [Aegicerativicinus sediminis]|uniref:DUF4251 domain-containing protein n=1 Tax=Aegicerativicinus sediminis TaxID=2893202 RepID=UPI001E41B1C1|nr:DUF4251 domain-containing protein [Aegicerativicinus sediminis]
MNIKILSILVLISAFLLSWIPSDGMKRKAQKPTVEELLESKEFKIECDWAMPTVTNAMNRVGNSGLLPVGTNIGRINLIGNANYLKFMGDSISADLPYYGERQAGGGYNSSDGGIKFNGLAKDMKIEKNEKKGHYNIKFSINNNTESFNVNIRLFPNLNSTISIYSNQRNTIRYDGTASLLEAANE